MKDEPIVPLTFISILLFSAVAGTQLAYFASANFFPEQIPSGIRINSAGTVEGTDLIQRSGNVYTLTGDLYRTIVILCDGIVLDGAGYALRGSGIGAGVFLQERNGVTIKNLRISNFEYAIKFTWLNYGSPSTPKSNKVISNTITNNTYGIAFYDFSSGSEVSGNYVANNIYGVYASNAVFRNNQFRNNDGAILESSYTLNDIDTSNTVNGKPIYYWVGQHNRTVPSDAGWVVLKNCSGITVQGLRIEGNGDGILLCYTTDSTIRENVITNNLNGITLEGSSNNVISANQITNNKGHGISLEYSSKCNVISKNDIVANAKDGVYLDLTTNNNIVNENRVMENNGNGIFFKDIQNSNVIGNNVTLNKGCGIGVGYGPNGTIRGNYISRNGKGIWMSNAFENTITLNNITENNGWGIELEGSQKNNIIHHNNFINNNVTEGLQVRIAGVWIFPGLNEPLMPPFNQSRTEPFNPPKSPQFVAGAANVWDDGQEGNYWSDYTTRYPNASEVGNTGVGDTPYFINENNIDRHPLMAPYKISINDLPSTSPSQEPEPEPFPTILIATASIATVTIVITGLLVYFKKRRN